MSEHIYKDILFWVITDDLERVIVSVTPFLIFIACLLWVINSRSKLSMSALLGGMFCLIGKALHLVLSGVNTIYLSGRQPTIDENSFIFYFYIYGHCCPVNYSK